MRRALAHYPSDVVKPRQVWLLALLAGLTGVLAVLVPLAPVTGERPVVSWPPAGEQAASTVLPLVPYRPLQLDATVPCATLQALDARPGGGSALRTVPSDTGEAAAQGLTVAIAGGQVVVATSGAEVLTEALPSPGCEYRVIADAAGVRVERDGQVVRESPGRLPPQVAELATDATGAATGGLAVALRPDDRYASEPTALKVALLVAHLLALAATLVLAVRMWRGRAGAVVRPRWSSADAVVVAVSAGWAVLGPVNWDDSWYLLMARNAGESGYLGNYFYMFNATENPFVASQYLLQAWGSLGGWGLLWMRMLPLTYGLVTWALLRFLLASALDGSTSPGSTPRRAAQRWVPWMLLVAHLLWWLPYGMVLRPEPLVALCAAGVLLLAELARRRRSIGLLGCATVLAALAITASPTGLVAGAPLVMSLPWLTRELRERGWAERGTAVLVAGAAATAIVPVGFADASLGEVLDATATHTWYYLTHAWYGEIFHYNYLLLLADTGVWGRRAPVVLTLAVLVLAAIGSGRRVGEGDPGHRLVLTGAITVAVALALLSATPTKWVNHFGAVAPTGTVLLTAALLRSPLPRRAGAVVTTVGVLVVTTAAALVFAGPNLWRPYSDWGQPFGDHLLANGTSYEISLMAPNIGPVYLRSPLVWLLVAAGIAGAVALWRRRGGRTSLTTDRGLLLAVSGLSVAMVLALFGYAPARQYPGWTVALSNVRALAGEPCGLATGVQVLRAAGPQPQLAGGAPLLTGDFSSAAGTQASVQPPAAGAEIWHDAVAEPLTRERGTVVTPWFTLPSSGATHLSVPVAAGTVPDQVVQVQFASSPDTPGRTVTLELDARADASSWQEVPVPLDGPHFDDPHFALARIVAEDRVTGAASWLAVATPSLTTWQPVESLTAGQPVFADQLASVLWPCVDQVAIRHGIVEPPSVRLLTDDGVPPIVLANPWNPQWGGTLVQPDHTATVVRMTSRIDPAGPPTRPWGQVERIVRDHPVGVVDLRVERVGEPGWHRDAPITGDAYSGRKYLG